MKMKKIIVIVVMVIISLSVAIAPECPPDCEEGEFNFQDSGSWTSDNINGQDMSRIDPAQMANADPAVVSGISDNEAGRYIDSQGPFSPPSGNDWILMAKLNPSVNTESFEGQGGVTLGKDFIQSGNAKVILGEGIKDISRDPDGNLVINNKITVIKGSVTSTSNGFSIIGQDSKFKIDDGTTDGLRITSKNTMQIYDLSSAQPPEGAKNIIAYNDDSLIVSVGGENKLTIDKDPSSTFKNLYVDPIEDGSSVTFTENLKDGSKAKAIFNSKGVKYQERELLRTRIIESLPGGHTGFFLSEKVIYCSVCTEVGCKGMPEQINIKEGDKISEYTATRDVEVYPDMENARLVITPYEDSAGKGVYLIQYGDGSVILDQANMDKLYEGGYDSNYKEIKPALANLINSYELNPSARSYADGQWVYPIEDSEKAFKDAVGNMEKLKAASGDEISTYNQQMAKIYNQMRAEAENQRQAEQTDIDEVETYYEDEEPEPLPEKPIEQTELPKKKIVPESKIPTGYFKKYPTQEDPQKYATMDINGNFIYWDGKNYIYD